MSTVWSKLQQLQGHALLTARGEPFDVVSVTTTAVIVKSHSERAPRFIRRQECEDAILYGPKGQTQVPVDLSSQSGPEAIPAFVKAMLREAEKAEL